MARIGKWLVALSLCARAFAEPTVELTVDRNEAAVGDEITAQVVVQGAQRSSEPQIDGLSAFTVERAGTSSQVQFVNGATSLSVLYNFVLVPNSAGTFSIGPARVTVGGKALVSQAVSLKVAQGAAAAQGGPSGDKPFQIVGEVDKAQAYVGEQLIYTFRFLSRAQLVNAQLSLPDFKGFLKEEIGKQKQYETVRNGVRWSVTEIKLALFPTQSGDKAIEAATLVGETPDEGGGGGRRRSPIDDFFDNGFFSRGRMKRVRLQSPGSIVKVLDLPAGKPQGFSGVVGSISARQTLSKQATAVGDSVTWTVEITGEGNLRDARWEPPSLPGFKIYDDQPAFQASLNGEKVGGTKVFKKALVPLEGGKRELPPLEIPYFDPEKGGYRVAKAPGLALEVSGQGGTAVAPGAPARQAVAVRGEDILAPRWDSASVTEDALTASARTLWYLLWGLGPLLFAGLGLGISWRRKKSGDTALVRRSKAYGSFRKTASRWNGNVELDPVDAALRRYLGDRFDTDGGALTPLDVKDKLRGVNETWVKEVRDVLDLCERARYGGGGDASALRERVVKLVEGLEKEKRP